MLNKVFLAGRVGKDATYKSFGENGVAEFSLATSKSYKKDGEWVEKTEWHTIKSFGKYAEKLASRVLRGSFVLVEGEIATRSYEKDGAKRYITEIIADSVKVIPSGAASNGAEGSGAPAVSEDDLPF